MSIANDIALAINSRLANITVANGYQTDLGLKIMRGRKRLDKDMLPCLVVVERDDRVIEQRGVQVKLAQPYIIEGHMACDPDNPNDIGHKMIADIKKAVFTGGNFTYGSDKRAIELKYSGRTIAPREDGIDVVSAGVEITVEYFENLTAP